MGRVKEMLMGIQEGIESKFIDGLITKKAFIEQMVSLYMTQEDAEELAHEIEQELREQEIAESAPAKED